MSVIWIGSGRFGSGGDPYWNNVSLLLHGNGANGSTSIIDSSPNNVTVTASNGAAISTSNPKYGTGSIFCNGATQSVSFPDPSLGSNNFTIETWLNTSSTVQYAQIIGNEVNTGGTTADGFTLLVNHNTSSDGQIRLYISSGGGATSVANTATGDWSDGNWHHIALTRSGNTFTIWTDGTSNGSGTWTGDVNGASTMYVGRNNVFSPRNLVGYFDDLRITKGVARYTSNFTPPAAQFPDGP